MSTPDISYPEAIDGFRAICREIGPNAHAYVSLNCMHRGGRGDLSATIYPEGLTRDSSIGKIDVEADSLRDLLARTRDEWVARRDEYAKRRTVDMAVEIIRQTDAIGHCADAALRAARFSDDEIKHLGPAACQRANEMASRGPFTIASAGKSNGAPSLMAAE